MAEQRALARHMATTKDTDNNAKTIVQHATLLVDVHSPDDPVALASPDREAWVRGAKDELRSLWEVGVF